MTLQGNLRRAGTVSAGTVALLLGGGGLAFAATSVTPTVTDTVSGVTSTVTDTTATVSGTVSGAVPTASPDPSSLSGTATGTVGSTTSTVTGTLGSLLSSPSPSPLPSPVQDVVDTVSNTLTGLLQQAPVPTPTQSPLGGGSQPTGDSAKKATPTHSPKPTVKTAAAGPTAYEVPPEAYLAMRSWTPPTSLGQMPTVAPANETAVLAAASAPELADIHGDKSSVGIPHPPIGGVPGLLVILATIAVGAVAAGHVGVLQQRLGRTPRFGRHAAA